MFRHDFPNLSDISADSDLIFILTDEFLEVQKPEMPNFVHIGGLGFENDRVQKLDEVDFGEFPDTLRFLYNWFTYLPCLH